MFRVTQPYQNLLVNPRIFSGFMEKYDFMHFERHFCQKKKELKKNNLHETLPKIFIPVTGNTLIF